MFFLTVERLCNLDTPPPLSNCVQKQTIYLYYFRDECTFLSKEKSERTYRGNSGDANTFVYAYIAGIKDIKKRYADNNVYGIVYSGNVFSASAKV